VHFGDIRCEDRNFSDLKRGVAKTAMNLLILYQQGIS
jgi:hypothetical protein